MLARVVLVEMPRRGRGVCGEREEGIAARPRCAAQEGSNPLAGGEAVGARRRGDGGGERRAAAIEGKRWCGGIEEGLMTNEAWNRGCLDGKGDVYL